MDKKEPKIFVDVDEGVAISGRDHQEIQEIIILERRSFRQMLQIPNLHSTRMRRRLFPAAYRPKIRTKIIEDEEIRGIEGQEMSSRRMLNAAHDIRNELEDPEHKGTIMKIKR
ncbi:unnamed protein product [Caenorhabditis bovis]|uniref:Uncharacterized protein n=1 Tax=Caenorhabditis bovis TaxID=2654633 RepID=A0A8S1EUC6_9PELO|nr:unnamed protein product [Caenorhabditis bovis]